MRASLSVLLWGGHVLAGTTYVYSTDTQPYRNASVHVGLVKKGNFRTSIYISRIFLCWDSRFSDAFEIVRKPLSSNSPR